MIAICNFAAARRRLLPAVVVGVVYALVACTSDLTPTPGPRPEPTRLLASGSGHLVYEEGCLFMVADADADNRRALVWPPDIVATVDERAGVVRVQLPDGGATTVKLGEIAVFAGGEVVGPNAEERDVVGKRADGSQPERCPSPYWLVSDVSLPTPTPPPSP